MELYTVFKGSRLKSLFSPAIILGLAGCGSVASPHIEDWDRERITEIPAGQIDVSVCFDHSTHSKEEVYALAREECAVRVSEVEKLIQHAKLLGIKDKKNIDPRLLEGPVTRQKSIDAMIASMNLTYVDNDKWDCPLLTPNSITFQCTYDKNAQDSAPRQQAPTESIPEPEMPPELPDDLKPQ